LRKILEQNLLTVHLSTVINMPNSGLDAMIDHDKKDDLSRLYRLFVMVPAGLPTLRRALRESIIRRGKELATASATGGADVGGDEDAEDAKSKGKAKAPNVGAQTLQIALKWVQDVLDLKDKFDALWTQAFQNDREIESSINEV
jgi:cullin 3